MSLTCAGGEDFDLLSNGWRCRADVGDKGFGKWIVGIDQRGQARGTRHQLLQQSNPFGPQLPGHGTDAGDIAARPVEAGNQTCLDRIAAAAEDDWNGRSCRFGRGRRSRAAGRGDDIYSQANQIGCQFRQPIIIVLPICIRRQRCDPPYSRFRPFLCEMPPRDVRSARANRGEETRPPASPFAARAPRAASPRHHTDLAMNSRRLMFPQGSERGIVAVQPSALERGADVRFGSKADICSAKGHVRFTPKSGHVQCN